MQNTKPLSRNKILAKLFGSRKNNLQIVVAGFGFLVGLLLLMVALQLYIKVNHLLSNRQKISEYIILSKKINLNNTISMGRSNFSKKEIELMRQQPFIDKVGLFTSNQYEVVAYSKGKIPFLTELFFESIPDDLIDEKPKEWYWDESSNTVPVIVAQDMLNLYNFGFALGKGLPQLSRSTIGLITVNIIVRGAQGEKEYYGKIVGFSERIPSVIVPESFMKWANKNIGENREENPSRVILKVNNPTDPRLASFFEKNEYQINQDRLQASRAGTVIQTVMSLIGIIGFFFILLSFVIFLTNFRVILAEAQREIELLKQLGYGTEILRNFLMSYFILFVLFLTFIAFVLLYFGNQQLMPILTRNGLELNTNLEPITLLVGLSMVALNITLNIIMLQIQLVKK